jgi:hypothetical protein
VDDVRPISGDLRSRITGIFDREVRQLVADIEPSGLVDWLEALRDEVVSQLGTTPEWCSCSSSCENVSDGRRCALARQLDVSADMGGSGAVTPPADTENQP